MKHGDRVICTTPKPERLMGYVLHVFFNGRVLVDVGTGAPNRHDEPDRDVRAFDVNKVVAA